MRTTDEIDDEEMMADLFHALNQPLTMLACSLELSLQKPRSAEDYRGYIREALQAAETIGSLADKIRRLSLDRDKPGKPEVIALHRVVQEAFAEWAPVAHASEVDFQLSMSRGCLVRADPKKLGEAIFHLIQLALERDEAGSLALALRIRRRTATLSLRGFSKSATGCSRGSASAGEHELQRRFSLALIRRLFAASGGRFEVREANEGYEYGVTFAVLDRSSATRSAIREANCSHP